MDWIFSTEELDDDGFETPWMRLEENPLSALIYSIYKSLNNVYGLFAAYVEPILYDDELNLMETPALNIDAGLMALAVCKVNVHEQLAPNAKEFNGVTTREYAEWLTIVKDKAFRAGVPLRAELLDLVYPDVYMNELLVGMRAIHQVLPAIMEKLGIDDFELDSSELRIR